MVNPKNIKIDNRNPKLRLINFQNFTFLETRTFAVGQPMGLLLTITYPTAGTWTNAIRV